MPVHSPIVVDFKIPDSNAKRTVLHQPLTGLASTLRSMLKEIHSIPEHIDVPKELLEATASLVKSKIELNFQAAKNSLRSAAQQGNTTVFWDTWCRCTAKGYVDTTQALRTTSSVSDTHLIDDSAIDHFGKPIFQQKRLWRKQTVDEGKASDIINNPQSIGLAAQNGGSKTTLVY